MESSGLLIFYQNVRGLRTKCLDMKQSILGNNYDIIIITETWLGGDIFDNEFCDSRYDAFRLDRDLSISSKSGGGGVMILVRGSLAAERCDCGPSTDSEVLWVRVPAKGFAAPTDLYVGAAYVRGYSDILPGDIDATIQTTTSIVNTYKNSNYLLVGDFNLPCIRWVPEGPYFLSRGPIEVQNAARLLLEEMNLLDMSQYNTLTNYAGNTLDLAFCNLPLDIEESLPLTKLDRAHPPFTINVVDLSISSLTEVVLPRRSFIKGDYTEINKYLNNLKWHDILMQSSLDAAVNEFYYHINTSIERYIPLKKHKNPKFPVWYSSPLIKITKEKARAHTRWKKYGNNLDYDEFSLLRARQKRVQERCFLQYTCNMENIIKYKPKAFWTYIKSLRDTSNYPKSFTIGGQGKISDGNEICNAFNNFFKSVFGQPSSCHKYTLRAQESTDSISKLFISESEVKKALLKLDCSKGAGSDAVPSQFWAFCAESVALPISIIFNRSLQEGLFPNTWKKALIIPIHKKGTKTKIENYRGISILNTVGKLFEKFVYEAIYPTINHSMSEKQHGFVRKRSTVTNLTCFLDYVLRNMDGGGQVDVVYTDFEKAFDRVDHAILLQKLEALGIHGDLLRWIESYLANRSQAVVIGGYRSDYVDIPTGVPQGSHLGPLFYCAYLYDIADCFQFSNHLLYADDKKIFFKVTKQQDCSAIQSDLNNLYNYYNSNNITVNVGKCQYISYTRKTNPISSSYHLNNVPIEKVSVIRDLGVLLDSKLSFTQHFDMIAGKAFRNLGFVLRSCKPFKNITSIKSVYYAYVRSTLEYAAPVWSPQYIIHKNQLERIQKVFINHLNYRLRKPANNYKDGCHQNRMLSLEDRRTVLDMSLLYDIVHGLVDCPQLVRQIEYLVPRRRTRHTPLFHVPRCSTNYAANSTLIRLARTFNNKFGAIDIFNVSKAVFKEQISGILVEN